MKRYVEGLVVIFLLAGCGGSHSGPPISNTIPPSQAVTLDATHVSVTLELQNQVTVRVSLPSGVPPPTVPITVSAVDAASEPAIVTFTSSGAVTMTAAPIVTMEVPTASSHRIIAESCRDSCKSPNEQIISPSSLSYTYRDTAPVTLGTSHTFSVTFAALPNYQLIDLSSGAPFTNISPVAINDSGTIAATGNKSGSGTGVIYSAGAWAIIPPLPGQSSAQPFAISNTGVVVGSSGDRAFRYSAGVSTALGTLPMVPNEIDQSNTATAISQDGRHIAGYTTVETHQNGNFTGFITATDFTAPGGPTPSACLKGRSVQGNGLNDSIAHGINSAGTLVGVITSSNTFGEDREIYACPVQQVLGDGTTPGEALAINEAGDIAGYLWPGFEKHIPFLYAGGALNQLPIPAPYTFGDATGLNNSDVVIGILTAVDPVRSASAVWHDGIAVLLNDLLPAGCVDWTLDTATAINNRGDIVGIGRKAGIAHAYLLQAVP